MKPEQNATEREKTLAAWISTMIALELREEPYYLTHQLQRCGLISPNQGQQRGYRILKRTWEAAFEEPYPHLLSGLSDEEVEQAVGESGLSQKEIAEIIYVGRTA